MTAFSTDVVVVVVAAVVLVEDGVAVSAGDCPLEHPPARSPTAAATPRARVASTTARYGHDGEPIATSSCSRTLPSPSCGCGRQRSSSGGPSLRFATGPPL